jgi:hypothetical protein
MLVTAVVLFVLGLRFTRARPRTIGFLALLLGFAIPLSASAITLPFTFANNTIADANQVNANFQALATGKIYGFVNANGTRNAPLNGGIIDVVQPATGFYCFKLGAAAKSAIATQDAGANTIRMISTFVPHNNAIGLSGCPTGYNDAQAVVRDVNNVPFSTDFYILFQ